MSKKGSNHKPLHLKRPPAPPPPPSTRKIREGVCIINSDGTTYPNKKSMWDRLIHSLLG
ncbi:MAG: hypothetical protein KAS32_15530 [Candidatus Peribacteraceae bacterium]|nr:hypothetical protein [Candidatus Peribacteraceae bacterium]